jgi:hypothetical protein
MPILVKEENDKDDFYKRITETRNRVFLTKSETELKREAENRRLRDEMYRTLIKNGTSHSDAVKLLKDRFGY